jgi:hypothetical protein
MQPTGLEHLTDEELKILMDRMYDSLKKHNALQEPNRGYSLALYEKHRRLVERMNNAITT